MWALQDYCDIVCMNQRLPSIRLIVIWTCRYVSHLITPDAIRSHLVMLTLTLHLSIMDRKDSVLSKIFHILLPVLTSMQHVYTETLINSLQISSIMSNLIFV